MIDPKKSSGNVYADIGTPDAEEMLVKARLAAKIGEIVKHRHLTQQQASDVLGMPHLFIPTTCIFDISFFTML